MPPIPAVLLLAIALLVPAAPAAPPSGADAVETALARTCAGRPLEAWRDLLDAVVASVGTADAGDPLAAAEWEVAAILLADLTARTGTWAETERALQSTLPWPDTASPEVGLRVRHLLARCLRRQGEADRARGTTDRLAYFSDWYVAGPFDNERGSGFDVEYEPERRFDRQAAMAGKEREVSWRWYPARHHPLARVSLDDVLRPASQVVAYLATSLQPRDPGVAELRVGSTGPYKVFVNGELVGANEAERPWAPDQDRWLVRLRDGWNPVLVKLGHEDGAWLFDARLTDLDGRPLRTVQCESVYTAWPGPPPSEDEAALVFYGVEPAPKEGDALEGWTWPRAPAPDDGPLPALRPGTREVLAARTDDARSLRLLVVYHLLVHPEDVTDETAREVARAAVALEPDDVLGYYLLARTYEARGASRNEAEVNKRLHALREVLARDPDHVAALLDLAEFALEDSPQPDRADELTARALAAAPGSWDARVMRARHLESRQRPDEAALQRREAEATAIAALTTSGALARARTLVREGLPDVAGALLRDAFTRDVLDGRLLSELLELLAAEGDLAGLLRVVNRSLGAEPHDLGLMLTAARHLEHGDPVERARARDMVGKALEICPEDVRALAQLVRIDERAGDIAAAAESLEAIVRLDPSDSNARRHLALLTEGTQERFEEPYRWDAAELVDLPLPDAGANDPVEVLRRTVVWQVHPDGTEHEYQHVAMRVLNEGGARLLDVYPVVGQGGATIYLYNARVIRADGTVEYAPAPRSRGRSYRSYDLPPLAPGDVVDIEYRCDQSEADVFGEYFGLRHVFYPDRVDALAPTRLSELVVLAPEDVPLTVVERNGEGLRREVRREGGTVVRRWTAEDLGRPPLESAMPAVTEFVPVVDVTTFRDWDHFATWYWHFIEKEFQTTPAMRDKVAELTAGLDTEREKIEAITRFVGQEIRYNAWPFGTHGYEPYSAPTIFERRFGDCKDKSILLRQLLAEIDVEAYPVLIKAESPRADEPLDAAMVNHFNHCIAYLPATDDREAMYLDATADRNPLEYLREDDQGATVLHVTPDGGSIHTIPFAPADENALVREYDVALREDGGADVRMLDTSNGAFGVRHRYRYGGETGDLANGLSRELSAGFGAVAIREVETSDLEDIGTPVRLDVTFDAPDLWSGSGDVRSLEVSLDPLGMDQVAKEAAVNRTFDVVLRRPFAHETVATYRLPPGARVLELPPDVEVEAPGLLDYRQTVRETDDGLVVRRSFRMTQPRVPVEDYAAFRDAVQQVRLAEAREVRVSVPGGDAP